MQRLIAIVVVGFFAQLVDGALGMAYGATSSTLLLTLGAAPAITSASVHAAEIGTTLAAGVAHWRFGNTDWRHAARLGVPGAIGAFAGATVLSRVPVSAARPAVSAFLFVLGLFVLVRFARAHPPSRPPPHTRGLRASMPLGLVAGFLDAAGGGAWGPIATPTLLARGSAEPRRIVGTVDTSEFLVALAASAGFVASLGRDAVDPRYVVALLAGGLVAAPLAAWLVRLVPARVLGVAIGSFILLTNANLVASALGVDPAGRLVLAMAVLAACGAVVVRVVSAERRARRRGPPGAVLVRP